MFKKISIRKIGLSIAALFALLLIYLIPNQAPSLKIKEELKYVDNKIEGADVFLMDKNSYVAMTEAPISEKDIEKRALELIKILTVGGMDSKVPSGFSAIIPPDTEVLNLTYERGILKINFSKDILDIDKNLEEKMIEAIVYTLTSIEKVDKVIIYVECDILTKLPKTKINLPSALDRSFGINKEFNLTSTKDITDVTIYYINQINDNYYYVPVTKYLNDQRDKINIIVEELSMDSNLKDNLKSYLMDNIKIVSGSVENEINLEFNKLNYSEDINEKIDRTVLLSICDNYDIEKLKINQIDKECKSAK